MRSSRQSSPIWLLISSGAIIILIIIASILMMQNQHGSDIQDSSASLPVYEAIMSPSLEGVTLMSTTDETPSEPTSEMINDHPENDTVDDGLSINSFPYFLTQDITFASSNADDPALTCATAEGQSLWYHLTPSQNGLITISIESTALDIAISIWTGSPGNLREVACHDSERDSPNELAMFAAADETYFLIIQGHDQFASGEFQLELDQRPCFELRTVVMPPDEGKIKVRAEENCANTTYYLTGTSVEVEAFASPGGEFREWGGDLVGNDPVASITMDTDKSIVAFFDESTQSIPVTVVDFETEFEGTSLTLHISYRVAGCFTISEVTQSRTGNTITVSLAGEKPIGLDCMPPAGEQIRVYDLVLDGAYTPGNYVITVNGIQKPVEID